MTQNTYVQRRQVHSIPLRASKPAPVTKDMYEQPTIIQKGITAERPYKLRPRSSWRSVVLSGALVFIILYVFLYLTMTGMSTLSQRWQYGEYPVTFVDHAVPKLGLCRFTGEILANGLVVIYQEPYNNPLRMRAYNLGIAVDTTPRPVVISFAGPTMRVQVDNTSYTYQGQADGTFTVHN